jgi:DNA-binding NtrC family response regulator
MPSHIILVEDNDDLRYAYGRMLEQGGHIVHPFPDYVGVVEFVDQRKDIHLLVVDIVMPTGKPHGVAIAAMVRHHRPGLPVVFLTGHTGLLGHLPDNQTILLKPIDEKMLLTAVATSLQRDSDRAKES